MEPIPARAKPADTRILWVEGHRDNREFLAVFLAMAGYVVTSCDSILQAALALSDRDFDIYIVGDCLPYGSNLGLTAEIKTLSPRSPLILYSALAFANDIERGLQAGAHAYMTKPGNLDQLLATIKVLLTGDDPRHAEPGGKRGRQSRRRGSAQPLVGTSDGDFSDSEMSNRAAHRQPAAVARPVMGPRRACRMALRGSLTRAPGQS